ncbi:MAG: 3-oxoacid CoA-transferase subunit A [Bacilli bacterium]|nr:3-oxoacid CoA-transferase subunit A [Bacilli bacterium]
MRGFIGKEDFKKHLKSGLTLMVGGFLANGSPEGLIDAILETDYTDFTIICNDGGYEDKGVGKLIVNGRVKKLIASHIGTNPTVGRLMQEGKLEVELVPQGTLIEAIRAGGAGLGGVLTTTGLNTIVQENKRIINIDGVDYLLEKPLKADLALIGGAICDNYGNLIYHKTMRNFNPIIALAAKITIANCIKQDMVFDPEVIITPYPFVDYIVVEDNDGR